VTNAWDKAKEAAERQAEKGGIFVRLKNNGDKVVGAFCGDPYVRDVVWTGQKYEEHDPSNPEHKGAKTSFRASLNFFVPAENAMKVIEGSGSFFNSVLKVRDKYGLADHLFEIERQGEPKDTKTKYTVLLDEKMTPQVRAAIAKAELHNLRNLGKGDGDDEGPESTQKSSSPITEKEALAIVERLRALPKSDVTAFLGKFGIARVRDLKESDLRAANELLDELTGTTAEVDPFA
jgi:hypothetical protein